VKETVWICRECMTGFEEGGEKCPSCGGSLVRIHFQGKAGEDFRMALAKKKGGYLW